MAREWHDRVLEPDIRDIRIAVRRSLGTARLEAHRREVHVAIVKLVKRASLAAVAKAAHQDVAEALALVEALAVSRREAALLEQREALDVRLAIDASMMGDEMLLQLQWLRQPASLLRLLERPVWLDAWLRGEEERASLLWRRLPNDLLLHLLKLRAANKRADARRPRLPLYLAYIDRVFLLKPRSWQVFYSFEFPSYVSMCEECEGQ